MIVIRSPRGRWGVLSPAYPWPIRDRLKTYPSLLNFLADDCFEDPVRLLSERLDITNDRVIMGLKLLLSQNDQFKNYLHVCPEIRYVNRYHPQLEVFYSSNIKSAKEAISKYRIRGDEVIEKRKEFELLGARVEGDEAVFDYDAREDVEKTIYSVESKKWNDDFVAIGNMIETYIFINGENPDFIMDRDIVNPSIFYIAKKHHGENIARLLTKIDPSDFAQDFNTQEVLEKTRDLCGKHFMYYIFPKRLHFTLNEEMSLGDIYRIVEYHRDKKTSNVSEIMSRLRLFESLTRVTKQDIMKQSILEEFERPRHIDILETEEQETFRVDPPEKLEAEKNIDRGPVIDIPSTVQVEEIKEIEKPTVEEYSGPDIVNDIKNFVPEQETPQGDPPIVMDAPVPPIQMPIPQPVPQPQMPFPQPQMPFPQPVPRPQVPIPQQPPQMTMYQPVPQQMPVPQTAPQTVPQPPQKDYSQVFKVIDPTSQVGKIIEPDETISPFNTRVFTYEGVKYKGMISAIYNLALSDLAGSNRVYASAVSALRKKILEQVEEDEIDKWWKEKGWVHLRNMLNAQAYVEKLYSHRHIDKKPLVFLASKRAVSNPVFEPYIGVVKLGSGDDKEGSLSHKGARYRGHNCTGQLI